ncbi:unnamed protein product [Caenorhabditis angaria]|uniref:Sushi domain-containing protein n=1 Tax=Caenorhabditis angaria TaxID=860376 RepID=A0A9P1IEV0_9PELO|nr:unnamed protein product [Caenorhabditis angaria]
MKILLLFACCITVSCYTGSDSDEECRDEEAREHRKHEHPREYECPAGFTLFNRAVPWCLQPHVFATDVIIDPLYSQINGFSLTVGGRRKHRCMGIPDYSHDSPCTVEATFRFPDNHTNPAFTIASYHDGQPDSRQTKINGKFYIEDCLTIYVTKGTAWDKRYNDIFGDFAVSPLDASEMFQSRGALCGVAATWKFL